MFGAVSFTMLIDGFSVITEIMNGPLGIFFILNQNNIRFYAFLRQILMERIKYVGLIQS